MHTSSLARVSLMLALVWSAQAVAAVVAGSTPGAFSVTNSGAASYRIPIQVPPGVAGLQPQLALQYDSQAPRGIAGPGWSLEGISAIRRCPKTKVQDNERGAVTLTSSDRFCYQGQRLVLESGQAPMPQYGASAAIYRTEIESFSRLRSYGAAGTGPQYFEVQEKSGLKLTFGGTADSRLLPAIAKTGDTTPTTVLAWYLSKVVDPSGNEITYTYQAAGASASGEILLSEVSYAGGQVKLKFAYVDDLNPRTLYVAGTRIDYTKLLSSVSTYLAGSPGSGGENTPCTDCNPVPPSAAANSSSNLKGPTAKAQGIRPPIIIVVPPGEVPLEQLVKHYRLGYDFSDVKGSAAADKPIARLTSVTECNSADLTSAKCLPATRFDWNYWKPDSTDRAFGTHIKVGNPTNPLLRFSHKANGQVNIRYEDRSYLRRFADLNGDGRPDLITFWKGGVYLYKSKSSGGYEDEPVKVSVGTDFVTTNDEDGWSDGSSGGGSRPRNLIDLNGDGFPDIIGFVNYSNPSGLAAGVYVAFWNPSSQVFGSSINALPKSIIAGNSAYCYSNNSDYNASDLGAPRYMVDLNNDGYPDIVRFTLSGIYASYWDSTNKNFLNPEVVSPTLNDFSMECGSTWFGGASDMRGVEIQPIFMEDMNGDGYPDIVGVGIDGTKVSLWDAATKKFLAAATKSTDIHATHRNTAQYPIRMADMNGDGYPDLVQYGADGVYVAIWTGTAFLPSTRWTTEMSGTYWQSTASANPRHLIDVNGDGFPDLVGFDANGVYVALSNGKDGFANKTAWSTTLFTTHSNPKPVDSSNNEWLESIYTPRFLLDITGDGSPELVGYGSDSIIFASPSKAPGTRIRKITDGLGATVEPSYDLAQPLSSSYSVYKRTARSTFPIRDAHGPLYVVSGVQKSDGLGSTRSWTYAYEDRRADFDRGLLGFAAVIATDTATGITTRQDFSQTYPFIGQLASSETTRNATKLSSLTNVLKKEDMGAAGEYSGNVRMFTYVESSSEQRKDLDGTMLWTKDTTNKYEKKSTPGAKQWGDLTSKKIAFSDGHEVLSSYEYEDPVEADWKLGRVSKSTVSSTRPARNLSVPVPTDAPSAAPDTKAPTLFAAYSPEVVYAGREYTVTTSTTDATLLTYSCTGKYSGSGVAEVGLNKVRVGVASADHIGETDCTFTATGLGGKISKTITQTIKALPPKPTVIADYIPRQVPAGMTYTLTTSTTDATLLTFSCTGAYSGIGSLTPGENVSVVAIADANNIGPTTCTFTATGPNGTATTTATQEITNPPPKPELSVAYLPNPVIVGSNYTLMTSTTNADLLSFSCTGAWQGTGSLEAGHNKQISAVASDDNKGETVCTFTATGPGGSTSKTVTQYINPRPPTVTAYYSPDPSLVGSPYTLHTSTTDATTLDFSCTGRYIGTGPLPVGENKTIVAQTSSDYVGDTTCTFTAIGPGGRASTTAIQRIRWPLPTVSASYSPNPVKAGNQYTLTTSTKNADRLEFSCTGGWSGGGTFAVGENLRYNAIADPNNEGNTVCTFRAIGPGGEATQTATQTIYR